MKNWTVSRRIVVGFSIVLALLLAVADLGSRSLSTVTDTYERALNQRRSTLVPMLIAESELRSANMAYLRFLLEGIEAHARTRDSTLGVARTILTRLSDTAQTDADRVQMNGIMLLFQ